MMSVMFALAIASAAQPVAAVTLDDPQHVVRFLQSKGYRAELKQEGGETWIRSGASGWNFTLSFKNCENGRNCEDLLLTSAWDPQASKQPTLDKINEFNRDKRFVRAYLDSENDPVLEMDVLFTDGQMSEAMFAEHLDVWSQMVTIYAKHIGME